MPNRRRLYRASDSKRILAIHDPPASGVARWRSPFWKDCARLIHSASFRRLQGKTQLFAGLESDFFRNRLTHSLEVAQIAKSIGAKLNSDHLAELGYELDLDLLFFAGLAHDVGHPPFGHTGEGALNIKMAQYGGFEGNAQTLRILARIEKKLDNPKQLVEGVPVWYTERGEESVGLNLTVRSLASILKYDNEITHDRSERVRKGYYASERGLVDKVRNAVLGRKYRDRTLKTVECQIMDIADDIAYSTYDLEDAFKGGLLAPIDLLATVDEVLRRVAKRCAEELERAVTAADVKGVVRRLFGFIAGEGEDAITAVEEAERISREYARRGFYRTDYTSWLVGHFVEAIAIDLDRGCPPLSVIRMGAEERLEAAVMKHLTYELLIESTRLRVVSYRGEKIVATLFDALIEGEGTKLLPDDLRERHRQSLRFGGKAGEARVVCDFIAGMTDRYAMEFYSRLTSVSFRSMFQPFI